MSLVSFRRTVSYKPPCALIQVKHMEGFWNDVFDGALYNCHHQNKKEKKYLQEEGLSCSVAETWRINVRGDWRCHVCMWWLKSLLLTLWACGVPHFLSQICHPLGHHSLTGDVTALCLLHTVHASMYLGRHCRCRGAEEVSFTPCHN